MVQQRDSELDYNERRLREIDEELASLRKEQRLFRSVGFGENLKAMQIVTLQIERRMCVAELPPDHCARMEESRLVRVRTISHRAAEQAVIGLTLLVIAARSALAAAARPRPAVARRPQLARQPSRPASNAGIAPSGLRAERRAAASGRLPVYARQRGRVSQPQPKEWAATA